jgi:hypothetical protein
MKTLLLYVSSCLLILFCLTVCSKEKNVLEGKSSDIDEITDGYRKEQIKNISANENKKNKEIHIIDINDFTIINGVLTISPEELQSEIGSWCFARNNEIKKVVIDKNVTSIGDCAFYECDNLKEVIISGCLKIIGENSFGSCENLSIVELPSGLTTLKGHAFYNCPNLTKINLPESIA